MLNAHAVVVQLYREKFQPTQKGVIGITLNHDWGEPLTPSAADIEAANTRNEFAMGW
jgi:beta-glucosidase